MKNRPTVLTLIGALWPRNDASGPTLSFKAMTKALGEEFRFLQVSRDRAFGATTAASETGRWIDQGFTEARFCRPTILGANGLGGILRSTPHDVLLLNGFFDRDFTIASLVLRRLGRAPNKPTILSPRGEFSVGALELKAGRKAAYLNFARRTNLLRDVVLHATSEHELEDIRAGFPWAGGYVVAPNVRALVEPAPSVVPDDSHCRLAFIGRISPVKNLDFALRVLADVQAPVAFTIYGPVQDAIYWARCQALIANLPAHITVAYYGEIANDEVPSVLATTDLFFLPSKSENFGHSLFEALSCAVPVLTSDQTPWRNLELHEAGFDLPLGEPGWFATAIDRFASMGQVQRERFRRGARSRAETFVLQSDAVACTRQMFEQVLKGPKKP